jgi:hypothetical protein
MDLVVLKCSLKIDYKNTTENSLMQGKCLNASEKCLNKWVFCVNVQKNIRIVMDADFIQQAYFM